MCSLQFNFGTVKFINAAVAFIDSFLLILGATIETEVYIPSTVAVAIYVFSLYMHITYRCISPQVLMKFNSSKSLRAQLNLNMVQSKTFSADCFNRGN